MTDHPTEDTAGQQEASESATGHFSDRCINAGGCLHPDCPCFYLVFEEILNKGDKG